MVTLSRTGAWRTGAFVLAALLPFALEAQAARPATTPVRRVPCPRHPPAR